MYILNLAQFAIFIVVFMFILNICEKFPFSNNKIIIISVYFSYFSHKQIKFVINRLKKKLLIHDNHFVRDFLTHYQ